MGFGPFAFFALFLGVEAAAAAPFGVPFGAFWFAPLAWFWAGSFGKNVQFRKKCGPKKIRKRVPWRWLKMISSELMLVGYDVSPQLGSDAILRLCRPHCQWRTHFFWLNDLWYYDLFDRSRSWLYNFSFRWLRTRFGFAFLGRITLTSCLLFRSRNWFLLFCLWVKDFHYRRFRHDSNHVVEDAWASRCWCYWLLSCSVTPCFLQCVVTE